jgi:hypothetical protein
VADDGVDDADRTRVDAARLKQGSRPAHWQERAQLALLPSGHSIRGKAVELLQEYFALTDIPGHVSYILIAISYGLTNIFWLRVTACIGLFLEIAYFWLTSDQMYTGIGWNLVFIAINVYQLFWLIHYRFSLRLPEAEAASLRQAFAGLDDAQIGRLLKAGAWRDLQPGDHLTEQDEKVPELYFLCSGRMEVLLGGRLIAHLSAGNFIGEVAFITGGPASATVIASEGCRVVAFDKPRLGAICAGDEQVGATIFRLLGDDLARKMVKVSERAAAL